MKKILVLCTGNSARSQLAEAYLRHFSGNAALVYSAGTHPHGVNPLAIQVMAEDKIDIASHTSNHISEYDDIHFDFVLTVCDNAKEQCPFFNNATIVVHNSFSDPGTILNEDILTSFRRVRDEIKIYSKQFVEKYINH